MAIPVVMPALIPRRGRRSSTSPQPWRSSSPYGLPTDLPWGLEIDPAHRVPGFEQFATFHPTFAYEAVWNLLVAAVLIWADRKFTLGRGKVFALYIALYGFGRTFTEHIRLDYSYDTFGPIRFNEAVAMLICLTGVGAVRVADQVPPRPRSPGPVLRSAAVPQPANGARSSLTCAVVGTRP